MAPTTEASGRPGGSCQRAEEERHQHPDADDRQPRPHRPVADVVTLPRRQRPLQESTLRPRSSPLLRHHAQAGDGRGWPGVCGPAGPPGQVDGQVGENRVPRPPPTRRAAAGRCGGGPGEGRRTGSALRSERCAAVLAAFQPSSRARQHARITGLPSDPGRAVTAPRVMDAAAPAAERRSSRRLVPRFLSWRRRGLLAIKAVSPSGPAVGRAATRGAAARRGVRSARDDRGRTAR